MDNSFVLAEFMYLLCVFECKSLKL